MHTNRRLKWLLEYVTLRKDFRIVDFGCGSGMLMELVAPNVASYTGVDFSEEFIAESRRRQQQLRVSNAEFVCSGVEEFCTQHVGRFDVGFALDFAEHVPDAAWRRYLEAMRLSLRQGGSLYLHTPNAHFFVEIMKEKGIILRQFPEHVAVRSPDEHVQLLRQAGYTVERVSLIPHYGELRVLHLLSHLPGIGRYFKARIFIEARK